MQKYHERLASDAAGGGGRGVYRLGRSVTKPGQLVLYYLQDGPPGGFVREELLAVQSDTQLPPGGVLRH